MDDRDRGDRRGFRPDSGPYRPLVPFAHLRAWTVAASVALILAGVLLGSEVEALRADAATQAMVAAQFFVARSDLAANHDQLVLTTRIVLGALAAALVLWLAWQYQAHANLRALRAQARFHPAVAVAGWVVPGVNVLLPLFTFRELYRGSEPFDPDPGPRTTPLLWLWWAAWAGALVLTGLAFRSGPAGPTARDLAARDNLLVVACLIGIAAAALGVVLLARIDARLLLREDGLRSPGWEPWTEVGSGTARR